MKKILNSKYNASMSVILMLIVMASCEQTHFEPALNAAPGGGTLTAYKAYTLDSVPGMGNIYGRVVFWEGNADNTLVQLSLYNTGDGEMLPSGIFEGETESGSVTELMSLYAIDGSKGEFSVSKYYVIDNEDFFSSLDVYDAHVTVFKSASDMTIISRGDVGANATPVQEHN